MTLQYLWGMQEMNRAFDFCKKAKRERVDSRYCMVDLDFGVRAQGPTHQRINMAKHCPPHTEPNYRMKIRFRGAFPVFLFSSQRILALPEPEVAEAMIPHQGSSHSARHIVRMQFTVTSETRCLLFWGWLRERVLLEEWVEH